MVIRRIALSYLSFCTLDAAPILSNPACAHAASKCPPGAPPTPIPPTTSPPNSMGTRLPEEVYSRSYPVMPVPPASWQSTRPIPQWAFSDWPRYTLSCDYYPPYVDQLHPLAIMLSRPQPDPRPRRSPDGRLWCIAPQPHLRPSWPVKAAGRPHAATLPPILPPLTTPRLTVTIPDSNQEFPEVKCRIFFPTMKRSFDKHEIILCWLDETIFLLGAPSCQYILKLGVPYRAPADSSMLAMGVKPLVRAC